MTKTDDDNGPCTVDDCALREAILATQWPDPFPAEPDVIEIPAGTYRLALSGPGGDLGARGALAVLGAHVVLRGDPGREVVVQSDGSDAVLHAFLSFLVIENVTFEGGWSDYGGGLDIVFGRVELSRSTVRSNHATVSGGGVSLTEANAIIRGSTISGNIAEDRGGGIYAFTDLAPAHAAFSLINSTISGNTAAMGGGVATEIEMGSWFVHATLADNSAPVASAMSFDRRPVFESSLIEGSCATAGSPGVSHGGNLESPGATCFAAQANDRQFLSDLGLEPLADNGGPTATHALAATSPAIDTAPPETCRDADQRGFTRPADGDFDGVPRCDVGAFERGAGPIVVDVPALSRPALWLLAVGLAWVAVSRSRS